MKLIIEISEGLYKHVDTIQNGSIGAKQILNAVKDGIPAYKAIPSAEPKWIPVSKPPKKDGKYLVTIHYINITRDTIETVNYSKNLYKVNEYDFYDRKRAGWYNYDSEYGYYEVDSVIAWMPLPKPYEPQERSE